MLKTITASIAFAALVGAASTALAARTHTQNDPLDHQANMLVRDSVGVGASWHIALAVRPWQNAYKRSDSDNERILTQG